MKWFKHFTDAHDSNDLTKVRMRYGAEGYAVYWYCLELIAGDLGTKDRITFELEHDAEVIGFNLKIDSIRVQEIMKFLVHLGLFDESSGVITCLKLAKYLDKKTTRNKKIHDIIDAANGLMCLPEGVPDSPPTVTGQSPDRPRLSPLDTDTDTDTEQKHYREQVHSVFDFWLEIMAKGGNTKLTPERKSKIKARLREGYSVDEIKQAIVNCSKSEFHMGVNDNGRKYDDLTLILRNGAKLEEFRDLSGAGQQKPQGRDWI